MRLPKQPSCIDCAQALPKWHTTRCPPCGAFYRAARRGDGLTVTKIYPLDCSVCGALFIGRKVNSAYCSDACERHSPSRRLSEERKGLARIGATVEQYRERDTAQQGRCALCGQVPSTARRLHFDHDHATGALRDLLCHHCNTGLGAFRDDPGLLLAAVAYLARHTDTRAVTGPDGNRTSESESS